MASDLTTTGPNVRTLLEDGNARASAVLTGGSILWKVLAYAEHIDFFLSFKGEKFSMIFDFFESAGWWMLAAVGILWFMATRGKGKEFAPQPLNWAFLLSCALMAFAFGSLITVKSSGQVPTVIVGWGGNATQCNAVVDTTRLLSFKDTHKIVLVCGIENQTIDKMADERILISNPFDIRPGGVAITANFSPKMDELKGIQGVVQVWEMIALVPPGVSREKISKLADIDNLGGKLVAPGYYK